MTYSMTAFAREENRGEWGTIVWEVRSVNHRYLDVAVRLPEDLRSLEPSVREYVRNKVRRGKVECLLRYKPSSQQKVALSVNYDLARQVIGAIQEISTLFPNAGTTSGLDILRWPGVVEVPAPDLDTIRAPILDTLNETLTDLAMMRAREGEKLALLIKDRCTDMSAVIEQVRQHLPTILAAQRTRIIDKFSEIKAELDPERLEQELVFFAQKIDVAEELDRLDTHLVEVERVLQEKKPIGRRLDFLMQEMHREANTLSAKSVDKNMTAASVELKVVIEQIREQVQNIE